MLFVGIDVAKSHHDVAILDHDGTIILRHLRIQNTRLGFELLINKLNDLTNQLHQPVRIAMESTGHYSTNIMMFMQCYLPTMSRCLYLVSRFRVYMFAQEPAV